MAKQHDEVEAADSYPGQDAWLRAIYDTAVDAIITIDDRGAIQTANPATERMFGYAVAELVGRNVKMLMPPPYCDEHDGYLRAYLQTGEKKIIGIGREVVGRRKNGDVFPMDLAVSESRGPAGRFFTGMIRDITERKRMEERLVQAERLAAIGKTVAGLAHESRNAFQRSQAALEMLALEVEDNEEALKLVGRIERAQTHIHQLYEEVRNYAAPIRLDREKCDVAHVWRDAWSQIEAAWSEKQVTLTVVQDCTSTICSVDPFALGQVFRNVLENAVAASPEGAAVEIHCREARLEGRAAVAVNVRDSGPGIPPAARDRVFEPFFTTKTKGTGLGMAIAHRIVLAHGGTIEVASGFRNGASFVITIPREAPR